MASVSFLVKEMVPHLQSLVVMYIRGHEAAVVLRKCFLGKEDAFIFMAYISTWKSRQRVDTLVAVAG